MIDCSPEKVDQLETNMLCREARYADYAGDTE